MLNYVALSWNYSSGRIEKKIEKKLDKGDAFH